MADIAQGQAGEVKYSVKFEGGKLVVEAAYDGQLADAALKVSVGSDEVINAIEKAIPGQIDDKLLELVKIALKAI